MAARRTPGSGSLFIRRDKAGRETWYCKFSAGGRQVMRALGRKREPGSSVGLTRKQAERELRKLADQYQAAPPAEERLTLGEAGERYLRHLEHVMERKPTTVQDYSIMLKRHLAPFFSGWRLDAIDAEFVAKYLELKKREGLSSKTVRNHLNFLHGVFSYAVYPFRGVARLSRIPPR